MAEPSYVRWFRDIGVADVALVGGKTASLGELYGQLRRAGVRTPNGFALTARAYRDALAAAGAEPKLRALLDGLDKTDVVQLADRARRARDLVYAATDGPALRRAILEGYEQLKAEHGGDVALAVRSSATAEDLPNASFAGQHESFLNVTRRARARRGLPALLRVAVHRSGDRLPHRQRLRSLQGRAVGRGDEDGPFGPGAPAE